MSHAAMEGVRIFVWGPTMTRFRSPPCLARRPRRRKQKPFTINSSVSSPWRRDSHQRASGIPGAVQPDPSRPGTLPGACACVGLGPRRHERQLHRSSSQSRCAIVAKNGGVVQTFLRCLAVGYWPLGLGRPQINIATTSEQQGADIASAFNDAVASAGSPLNAKMTKSKIGGPGEAPFPLRVLTGVATSEIKVPHMIDRSATLFLSLVTK